MLHFETIIPETRFVLEKLMQDERLDDFRLVGGTALSLLRGHRMSDDIDLFHKPELEQNKHNTLAAIKSISDKPSDLSITDMNFGYSAYYNYNVQGDFLKIDLFHFESDPFLKEPIIKQNIRLASLEDISAMKLNAITSRSTKKDFIDIDEILKTSSIGKMLDNYEKRYPYYEKKDVILALSAIDKADNSTMPEMLNGRTWDQVKKNITSQVNNYLENQLKTGNNQKPQKNNTPKELLSKAILANDEKKVNKLLNDGIKVDKSHLKLMSEMKTSPKYDLNPKIESTVKASLASQDQSKGMRF